MSTPGPLVLPPPPARQRARPTPLVLGIALVASFALVVLLGASPATSEADSTRDGYSFIATGDDGAPYRWDPCTPIRYQVDLAGQPASALPVIHEAVRRTAAASGMEFTFDGVVVGSSPVDLIHSMDFVSSPSQGLYRWSPILITFAPAEVFASVEMSEAAGFGMPVTSRYDPEQYVSGLIVINSDAPMGAAFEYAGSLGPIVQHELGHVLGLGHSSSPAQLMYEAPFAAEWNTGDIAGFERLGSGSCLLVPAAFPNGANRAW